VVFVTVTVDVGWAPVVVGVVSYGLRGAVVVCASATGTTATLTPAASASSGALILRNIRFSS
jgi:hypothetical protein